MSDLTTLLYGRPKVGKTTLAAQFPGALFLATEAGHNALECSVVPVDTYEVFLTACGEIAAGGHDFRTIIVDTAENLYALCRHHLCERLRIDHESDLPFGKGFSLVQAEFQRSLTRLSHLPYGLVLISHAEVEEIHTRTGVRHRLVPALPSRARRFVLGLVDLILLCDVETAVGSDGRPAVRRVIRTKPTERYEAGDRTGLLPETVDMGYSALAAAFAAARDASRPTTEGNMRVAVPVPLAAPQ